MDNDPTSRSQNSRKRTRVDDTSSSFHLPSSDTMSALSNASRLRDPNTHGLLHNSTISAAEAAAVAAAAVGTSTPTSTTPILQPLHPPIPNFSAISQAPQLRPQNSLSHTLPSEQNHPATGIYSIALPLPNPGRAHRFCQACDHVCTQNLYHYSLKLNIHFLSVQHSSVKQQITNTIIYSLYFYE